MTGSRLLLLLLISMTLGTPQQLTAQKKAAAPPPACVFDSAAHTEIITRQLLLTAYRLNDSLPDVPLTRAFGALIQPHFVAPEGVVRLFFPAVTVPDTAKVVVRRSLFSLGAFSLRIGRDGVVRNLNWDVLSYDPATEDSLVQPLVRASGSPEMKSIGAMVDSNLVRLLLTVGIPDSLRPPRNAAPLLQVRLPALRIDSPPQYRDGPTPHYPLGPRGRGIEGRVMMHFVVGEDGRVLKNSLRVDEFNLADFAKPAIDAVTGSRFVPAMVAGCPTPMMVQQVVRFTLGNR